MIKDTSYIKKIDEQEWLDEIKPIVLKCCKKIRSCVGWNNIVEHLVWQELKQKHQLKTFPKNLYKIVRSQFDECLKTAKPTMHKVEALIEKCDSILAEKPAHDKFFAKATASTDEWFVFDGIDFSWLCVNRIFNNNSTIDYAGKTLKVRTYKGQKYFMIGSEARLLVEAKYFTVEYGDARLAINSCKGKVMNALLKGKQIMDVDVYWAQHSTQSLDDTIIEGFDELIARADSCAMTYVKQTNDLKKLKEMIG